MGRFKKIIAMFLAVVLMITVLPLDVEAAGIRLNKTKTTIYVGSSEKLKIEGTSRKVKWSSSDEKVAKVSSSGRVSAKKAGTAQIRAKVAKKTYRCRVTVKKPYLNKTKISIQKGKTYQLKLTGTKAVSWKSSDQKTAGVSAKGEVSAKKAGTATITCKGKDKKTYRCRVTVTNPKKHKHSYTAKVTKKASCTRAGVMTYTCSCGHKYTQVIGKRGHRFVKKLLPETSKNKKSVCYVCKVCGYRYEGSDTESILTETQVYLSIVKKKSAYPEGMKWTNENFYEWKGGIYRGGYGCAGFAFLLSDAAFGSLPASRHKDFSNIRVGDVLRIKNDTHSVIVLEVKSDSVVVAEGNYRSSIHWGREIALSEIRKTGTHVLTRYPQ